MVEEQRPVEEVEQQKAAAAEENKEIAQLNHAAEESNLMVTVLTRAKDMCARPLVRGIFYATGASIATYILGKILGPSAQ
ncbi:MAG: hypothetical protein P4M10_08900 [Verrucomicrobiae bacterium]|nr:hypothetical protein [Verrucomicrobiae bacterium]